MTHVSFDVSVIDDTKLEDTENFTLTIVSSSQHINDPDQATVIIVDNDGKKAIWICCYYVVKWMHFPYSSASCITILLCKYLTDWL